MIITIDGASGTGKTTVAQKVAQSLKIPYFDTGAMYRAFTWYLQELGISSKMGKKIESALESFVFDIRIQEGRPYYYVNDQDVTLAIRSQKVTEAVSEVSALPKVRKAIWKMQRAYSEKQSAVFEGRDMGSVVFPNAEVKIFLHADPSIRAKRRLAEMREKLPKEAPEFDEEKMKKELKRRDTYDSTRKIAPLKCPRGAHTIDTTELTIDQVVKEVVSYCHLQSAKLEPSWLKSKKMKFFYRLVLFLAWNLFKVLYRYRIYGLEHYTKRAAIIAPNHTSYFDPPVAAVSWPEELHFLARESLFKPFLFGPFIRALNAHPVHGDVADVSVFKTMIELLKEGKQIVLFPEGGRTDGQLAEIKPGIGMLAIRAKCVIVPTYIHGADQVWGRNRKLPKLRGKISCVFGSPIPWESFGHLDKKKAQEEIAKTLTYSLLSLKRWYEAGAKGTPP